MRLFTSEAVSPGHPDKVADQVSDAILDELLRGTPPEQRVDDVRCACETLVREGLVVLAGEWRQGGQAPEQAATALAEAARGAIREIGYDGGRNPDFDADRLEIRNYMVPQSREIGAGVDRQQGAGDQGIMFGYATDEVAQLPGAGQEDADARMPAAIHFARKLIQRHTQLCADTPWLMPDAKAQVTFSHDEAGTPLQVEALVFSTMHRQEGPGAGLASLREWVLEEILYKVVDPALRSPGLEKDLHDPDSPDKRIWINPAGTFVKGGPAADCGLTGRKIIVDTYGGAARHGGGAFSGKDPTKVDRSAAYAARHLAKNLVAAGVARRCEVQLAYAIGVPAPVSVRVDSFGTGQLPDAELEAMVRRYAAPRDDGAPPPIDLRPAGICDRLDLWRPMYRDTAAHGHFGREGLPWENTDLAGLFCP